MLKRKDIKKLKLKQKKKLQKEKTIQNKLNNNVESKEKDNEVKINKKLSNRKLKKIKLNKVERQIHIQLYNSNCGIRKFILSELSKIILSIKNNNFEDIESIASMLIYIALNFHKISNDYTKINESYDSKQDKLNTTERQVLIVEILSIIMELKLNEVYDYNSIKVIFELVHLVITKGLNERRIEKFNYFVDRNDEIVSMEIKYSPNYKKYDNSDIFEGPYSIWNNTKKYTNYNNEYYKSFIINKNNKSPEKEYIDYYRLFELTNKRWNMLSISTMHEFEYNQIIKNYEKIIISNEKLNFLGGAYVNCAQAILCRDILNYYYKKKDLDEKILIYINNALEIKAENKVALGLLGFVSFINNNIDECIEAFNKLSSDEIYINEYLEMISNIDINYTAVLYNDELIIDKIINEDRTSLYRELYNSDVCRKYKENIENIIYQYYFYIGKYLEAYNFIEKNIDRKNKSWPYYQYLLGNLCIPGFLNQPKKAIQHYEIALANLNKSLKIDDSIRNSIESNLAVCYIENKEFDKAINILSKRKVDLFNNTNLYNLSRAYYGKKEYKKALDYINKSLYIFEDELGYFMLGKILRRLEEYEKALIYLKKSFFFLENEKLNFIVEEEGMQMTSIVPKESIVEKEIEILYELIQCNIGCKKFESAFTITQLSLKKYPSNERFLDLNYTISTFIDMENKKNILNENLAKIKSEYELEKINQSNNAYKMRNWAVELMKLQGLDIEFKEDDREWSKFEKRMDDIIDKMKTSLNSSKYKGILNKLSSTYSNLNRDSISTLATGEYLYEVNKNSTIDFAPIIVAMCKCIEIEINIRLRLKPKKTIGQIQQYLRERINNYQNIDEFLNKIRLLRNRSAHTGAITKEKVEELRVLIYGEKGLNYILSLLDNKLNIEK